MKIINRGAESAKNDTQELHEALQDERSSMLAQVRTLQLATRLLLQAEAQRLAQKNSADPRVATLALQQHTLGERVAVLDTELEVAAIRTPTVTKTDTLIHGRVADDANRAAGPLTVLLVNANGRPVEALRPVQADASGYYAFVIEPEVAAKLQAGERFGIAVRNGDTTVVPASTEPFAFASGTVAVKDVALTDAELRRLQLRVDFSSTAAGLKPKAAAAPRGKKKA